MHISDFFCTFTPVFVRMHSKGAHTYTQEQINYDERILFIDRSAGSRSKCRNPLLQNMFRFIGFGEKAGSGADIIAKGWEENHWARPTIKDSYFPSEETELILDLLKEGGQTGGQSTTHTDSKTSNGGLNGGLKVDDIALKLKLGKRTIERELATLQKQGVVRRVDSKKGGHWEIIVPEG